MEFQFREMHEKTAAGGIRHIPHLWALGHRACAHECFVKCFKPSAFHAILGKANGNFAGAIKHQVQTQDTDHYTRHEKELETIWKLKIMPNIPNNYVISSNEAAPSLRTLHLPCPVHLRIYHPSYLLLFLSPAFTTTRPSFTHERSVCPRPVLTYSRPLSVVLSSAGSFPPLTTCRVPVQVSTLPVTS